MIKFRYMAVIACSLVLTGCGSYSESTPAVTVQREAASVVTGTDHRSTSAQPEQTAVEQHAEKTADGMQIVVDGREFAVTLEENATVTALTGMLPLTLDMSELNGNEKYHYLDTALPSAPEKVGHISEGDIMLYGDRCLVVFYKSFDTSYTYTKIGHIADTSVLADTLGTGGAAVRFERTGSPDTAYTVQDVRNLCDFLLAKPTENNLTGKPYDLDNDGVWSAFDLCLIKRKIQDSTA